MRENTQRILQQIQYIIIQYRWQFQRMHFALGMLFPPSFLFQNLNTSRLLLNLDEPECEKNAVPGVPLRRLKTEKSITDDRMLELWIRWVSLFGDFEVRLVTSKISRQLFFHFSEHFLNAVFPHLCFSYRRVQDKSDARRTSIATSPLCRHSVFQSNSTNRFQLTIEAGLKFNVIFRTTLRWNQSTLKEGPEDRV